MFMTATALFLLLTLLAAGVLIVFMLRTGAARPMTVWALAALLPVLAAMTAANAGQAGAERTLQHYAPMPSDVVIHTGGRIYRATLDANDAACLERDLRLNAEHNLLTPQGYIPIRKDSTADGPLPSREVVEALSLRGELNCANFKSLNAGKK